MYKKLIFILLIFTGSLYGMKQKLSLANRLFGNILRQTNTRLYHDTIVNSGNNISNNSRLFSTQSFYKPFEKTKIGIRTTAIGVGTLIGSGAFIYSKQQNKKVIQPESSERAEVSSEAKKKFFLAPNKEQDFNIVTDQQSG